MNDGSNIVAIRATLAQDDSTPDDAEYNSLMNDPEVANGVVQIWGEVFKASNNVLLHAQRYGFFGMTIVPDPNIHGILVQVRAMTRLLDALLTIADGGFGYDETRLLLNAREQMNRMERLALALTNDKRDDFDAELLLMKTQAAF